MELGKDDQTNRLGDPELLEKVEQLTTQLNLISQQRDLQQKIYNDLEQKYSTLKTLQEKEHNDLNVLRIVHNEALCEIETLREALHTKIDAQIEQDLAKKKQKQKQLKGIIREFQCENQKLQKQADSLEENYKKLQQQNENSIQQMKNVQEENLSLKAQIEKLLFDLNEAKSQNDALAKAKEKEAIPQSAWSNNCFEPSLSQQICAVASNDILQSDTKLKQVYKLIQSHYSQQIDALKGEIKQIGDDNFIYLSEIQQFFDSIARVLNCPSVDIHNKEVVNKNLGELINLITQMQNKNCQLTTTNEAFQAAVSNAANIFDIKNISDPYSTISAITSEFESNLIHVNKLLKKNKTLNNSITNLKAKSSLEKEEHEACVKQLNDTIKCLKDSNQTLSEENCQLKGQLNSIKCCNQNLQSKADYLQDQCCKQQNEVVTVHNNQIICLKKQYNETIEHLSGELNKANKTIIVAETQIRKYKKALKELKNQIEDDKEQIQKIKQESEIAKKKTAQKIMLEKKQLIEGYEAKIANLNDQSSKFENDFAKASANLIQKEKKLKEIRETYCQLKREHAKLVKDTALKEEEHQREAKIQDAAIKNANMLAESQYTAKLNEMKMKWEEEKKSLLVYVADEFNQFFNAKEVIDEKSFRATIQRAKAEIERLQRSDCTIRKLVNVGGQQSTDDAVARLVFAVN